MTTKNPLLRCTPEAQGISSEAIIRFVDEIEKNNLELHSLMLLRGGQVVAEGWWSPYSPTSPHMLFSLSKSFTSTAIGLAVAEGRLTVDDPVISFFPEECPEKISENLAAMRVRHLLSMSTGHHEDSTGRMVSRADGNWVKGFLSLDVEHEPGTYFVYNSGATYMLSAIIQKITGSRLLNYLKPRLFTPLGIQNPTWESCPRGIHAGGWGLSIKTEDIARFGQMYLQKGMWNGKRILPEAWIEEATSRQVPNGDNPDSDWNQGYGYQFWRCRHNIYRGDGAFGQYCIVMPEQNAVLAMTSGVADMQAVMNHVWDHLLPGMAPQPLPENPAAQAALQQRLVGLALPEPPQGMKTSPWTEKVSGKRYLLEATELQFKAQTMTFAPDSLTLTMEKGRRKQSIKVGLGEWCEDRTDLFTRGPAKSLAQAAWIAEDTLRINVRLYETPFSYTLTCRFSDGMVHMDAATNVSFGPTALPQLVGRVEK